MLRYLWSIRARPPVFSGPWFRFWAKRLITLRSVLSASRRTNKLRRAGADVGTGVFISPADIQGSLEQLSIGDETFVGRVQIQVHAQISIGSHVCLNDGVRIFSASHRLDDPHWRQYAKPVVVEDYCWIASGALILSGVRIGRGAVVGAGAVVSRDVPPLSLAVGNPAKIISDRRVSQLDYSPTQFLAGYIAWAGPPRCKGDH